MRHGLTLALFPRAIHGSDQGGPRGLMRIGLPLRADDKQPGLLNFIAVEPVTRDGRRGFSELEKSPADGQPGIRFWCERQVLGKDSLRGGDILRLTIKMERFANGAHPQIVAVLSADRPHEVRFEVYAEPDSAPVRECILTATMGNYQRLRRLHLKNRVVTTECGAAGRPGDGFTAPGRFGLSELTREISKSVAVAGSSPARGSVTTEQPLPGSAASPRTWRLPTPHQRESRG